MADNDPYVPPAYAHRAKPFAAESVFRFHPAYLAVEQGKRSGNFPYRDIVQLRLLYKPKNTTNQGFEAKIIRRDRHTAKFSNISWRGMIEIERRDADYRRFVEELAAKIADANPDAELVAGMQPWLHRVTALAGIGAVGIMLVVGWQAYQLGSWQTGAFAAALAAYFGWWASRYVSRNRPRRFLPGAIPEDVLPQAVRSQ